MSESAVQFSIASFVYYDVCSLKGEMTVAQITGFAPHLLKHVQSNSDKHLVIDLSEVPFMDSSAIRLVVNLKKRLDENKRKLFLLSPSKGVLTILQNMRLDTVLSIAASCLAIDREIAQARFAMLSQCAHSENHLRRLSCQCAVCGSDKVIAYLVDSADYNWRWIEDDPFPTCTFKTPGVSADYFALLPAICLDCGMCAIDTELFHTLKNGKIAIPATLDQQAKLILSKGIKRRKSIAENSGCAFSEEFFGHARTPMALACAYTLAQECAQAIAVGKKTAGAFTVGYVTYLALRYIDSSHKEEFINKCRTWFTQALTEHEALPFPLLARAYFILMNAALNLDKMKEAADAHQRFVKMMETVPAETDYSFESPRFWFDQAQNIWRRTIAERSKELVV